MTVRTIVLTGAAIAAFLWMTGAMTAPGRSVARERAPAHAAADSALGWTAQAAPDVQGGGGPGSADDSTRVPVQVWTVVAAVGAAAVGLVLFLLRLAAGWVKGPPQQEDSHR